MTIFTKQANHSGDANGERPDAGGSQPHPEKPSAVPAADAVAREVTREYVERVNRYLARPDVVR
jgi:hypothetical protein